MCREKKYDLILLDHMMPQPDGIETLHIIRKDEKSLNNDTKVVVLTANAVAGSRQLYIDEGFDDYLTKPLDSSMLEQMVKSMLPKEKVLAVTADKSEVISDAVSPIKKKLLAIDGLDYDTALGYCAGEEELLEEIVSDIASESEDNLRRMKASLESGDIKAYQIDVHSVKSSMATIGLMSLSERAKKHEFAAKDNDIDFIKSDAEEFFREYEDVCSKLKN
jgi:CheY-like chemotaxis protein/HPt (histidine-containing phosphotransfer) domain-containing protein